MQTIHTVAVDMFRFTCLLLALVAACSGATIPGNRIVGGITAKEGDIPWQVSLRSSGSHFCGGSIVNERWVITAAHCLTGIVSTTTVVTNTLYLNSGGDIYRAGKFVPHPEYDSYEISNDVGLIETTTNIIFSDIVQPVRLPTGPFTDSNVPAVVSGWGRTSYPGNAPNHLQVLDTIVISQSECAASNWRVTDNNICTFTKRGQGNCHGDSGGPLTSGNTLIGVVSFGNPCAVGTPDAYTRVFSFIDWIRGYTG